MQTSEQDSYKKGLQLPNHLKRTAQQNNIIPNLKQNLSEKSKIVIYTRQRERERERERERGRVQNMNTITP